MKTEGGAAVAAAFEHIGACNRRQFLAGTAALMAGTYLLGPNTARDFEEGRLGELLRQSTRPLSVGFIAAAHGVAAGRDALTHGARVVSATALRAGSRALHGTTVVGVHGLTAGLADPVAAGIHAVHLDALIPAPRELADQTPLPFHAWTLRAQGTESRSPNSAFTIDLDGKPRLGLALELLRREAVATVDPARAVFSTGRQSGMAKLRPGTYLIGLAPGVWDRPRTLPDPADEAAWAAQGLASLILSVKRAA